MSKVVTLFFVLFVITAITPVFAQPPDTLWTQRYERPGTNESVTAIEQNADGDFLLFGTISDTSGEDNRCFIMKINSQGILNWFREYGETTHDFAYDGIVTSDGGYIIVGASSSGPSTGQDAYIIKTNAVGDTQWTRKIDIGLNLNRATSVVETGSGFVVAGFGSTWDGENCATVIRLLDNGDTLWTRMYCRGEFGSDIQITSVIECFDGFVLGGSVEDPGLLNGDIYLIHINTVGDTVWTLRWGQSGIPEYVTDLGSNGDLYVVGMGFQIDEPDVLLMRVNASGDTVWTRQSRYGSGDNAFTTLKVLSSNRFAIFGETRQFVNDHFETQALIGSYSIDGNVLWTRGYSVPNPDWYTAGPANITNDGGYILAGTYYSEVNPFLVDIFLIRTEAELPVSDRRNNFAANNAQIQACYPNPTNGMIYLDVLQSQFGDFSVAIYNLLGQRIAVIHNGPLTPGLHKWGYPIGSTASGEYFFDIANGSLHQLVPFTVIR